MEQSYFLMYQTMNYFHLMRQVMREEVFVMYHLHQQQQNMLDLVLL